MYGGRVHGAGTRAGIGVVSGREVLIHANDPMIKGGTVYPMGVKKTLRCQTIAMENRLQRILELLLRAKYSREKAGYLNDANMELEVLRFQVRLAKDLKALPAKSHGHAAGLMQGIGAQIGGWLASKGGRA
jgi:hypothetical protein